MSEADVKRLSEVEDVDEEQAEKALDLGDGNFDQARHLLRQAPAALKFRFTSQEDDVYGLGLVVLGVSPPGLEELASVVGNDRSLGTVTLSQDVVELKKEIAQRSNQASTMAALGRRLEEQLTQSLSPPPEEWVSYIKARNETDLQRKLEDLVMNILDQQELVLSAELEVGVIDYDEDETSTGTESDSDDHTVSSRSHPDRVELLCDVKVSPVKGKSVQNLQPGEAIFVDLKEGQDEHRPVIEVIERLRDEQSGLIPTKVDSIRRTESGKVEINVQFGENVFGKTIAGEDMNILTPEAFGTGSDRLSQLYDLLPWILFGVGLLALGIVILYALFMIP
ncbi:MAG: hypothetical protein ABEK50_08010 [bacterium]